MPNTKPRIAVHKFASCDGCQLAFLNAGEQLLQLAKFVDIVHFAEAGPVEPAAAVDIAFVEGSISTPQDIERIQAIRANSRMLITIGACATSGGLQALRNLADADTWVRAIYAHPEYIESLSTSTAIADHVTVDFQLWGCPVTRNQVLATIRALLFGVEPVDEADKVCMACKRDLNVCVLVTGGEPCLGPVTRTGCGALCPRFGRDCYGCFGPAETVNTDALANRFEGLGLVSSEIAQRFLFIHNHAAPFLHAGISWRDRSHD